jgi:hypothetical protein
MNVKHMKPGSTEHSHVRSGSDRTATANDPQTPAVDPSQFPVSRASTGTVDDYDQPEDEHERENEASERETSDDTEAPEEFHRDNEGHSRFDE